MTENAQSVKAIEWAYQRALRYLSLRPRSCGEVREYLQRKGHAVSVVEKCLNHLQKEGLLNDEEFAWWWAKQRLDARRPKGRLIIRQELKQKKVSPVIIATIEQGIDEKQAADRLAKSYLDRLKVASSLARKTKLKRYLFQRGFSLSKITAVIDSLLPRR